MTERSFGTVKDFPVGNPAGIFALLAHRTKQIAERMLIPIRICDTVIAAVAIFINKPGRVIGTQSHGNVEISIIIVITNVYF